MRNLVLGSQGFAGKFFCDYLLQRGEQVIGIDIKISSFHDLRECEIFEDGIDRIFFLAWDVGGSKYLYRDDTQLTQISWNTKLLHNVMPQLEKFSIPFVFISSQLAQHTDNPYGVLKRTGEVWTRLTENGISLRFWNLYGAIEPITERSHLISDLIRKAIDLGRIELFTDGEECRQFVHLEDACNAMIKATELHLHGEYDVSNFSWISVKSVAHIIADLTGAKLTPGTVKGQMQFSKNIRKLPDWDTKIAFRTGLENMIRSYKG